jgi:cytochrome c oxidase subunit 4
MHSSYNHEQHVTSRRTYLVVYIALLLLLVITVAVSYVDLGAFGIVAAFVIAAVKALVIVIYFMHLRHSGRLTWIFAGAGLVWLAILFGLTLNDYVTRVWSPAPGV